MHSLVPLTYCPHSSCPYNFIYLWCIGCSLIFIMGLLSCIGLETFPFLLTWHWSITFTIRSIHLMPSTLETAWYFPYVPYIPYFLNCYWIQSDMVYVCSSYGHIYPSPFLVGFYPSVLEFLSGRFGHLISLCPCANLAVSLSGSLTWLCSRPLLCLGS